MHWKAFSINQILNLLKKTFAFEERIIQLLLNSYMDLMD